MPRGLDKPHRDSEDSLAKSQAEFDEFGREAALRAADTMEKSGAPGSAEAAAVLRRAYDPAGEQLSEAKASAGGKSMATGLDIGTGGKADLSADKAVGNDMLERGTSKTRFGEGIDLGARLDAPKDSKEGSEQTKADKDRDGLNPKMYDDPGGRTDPGSGRALSSAAGGQISLADHSGLGTSAPRAWSASSSLDPAPKSRSASDEFGIG